MIVRYSRQQDVRLGVGSLPLPIGGGRSVNDHFTQALVDLNRVVNPKVVADVQFSFGRALGAQLGRSNGFDLNTLKLPASYVSSVAPQFPVFNISDVTGTSNGSDANRLGAAGATCTPPWARYTCNSDGTRSNLGATYATCISTRVKTRSPQASSTSLVAIPRAPRRPRQARHPGFGVASFLLGDITSGTVIQNNRLSTQGLYYAGYMQDDWRVNDRLTLNLGLRYDVGVGDREKYNRLAWFDPNAASPIAAAAGLPALKGTLDWVGQTNDINQQATDHGNLGPRFGFAYKAT